MGTGRKFVNAVLLAVFAVVSIGAMEVLAFNIGQSKGPFDHTLKIHALFSDADGLPSAADVVVAGVAVGKVTDVAADRSHPGFTSGELSISDANVVVYPNAAARVRPKSLLGEKYVDLDPGTPPKPGAAPSNAVENVDVTQPLPSGATLLPTQTSTSVENDQIFNAFDAPTRANQQRVIAALDTALSGRSGDIQAILPQLDEVVRNLTPVARVYEKDNAAVDQIFTNLDSVMANLAEEHTQLASFLSSGNQALAALAQRDNALVTTMQAANKVNSELTTIVTASIPAQHAAIDATPAAIDTVHTFVNEAIRPQQACGGKTCGIVEILSGTLSGFINYPTDQLTISTPTGETVAQEWASMFSVPTTDARSPGSHSALNLVLAEQCDTVSTTLRPITNIDPTGTVGKAIAAACATGAQQSPPNGTPGLPGVPGAPPIPPVPGAPTLPPLPGVGAVP